MTYRVLQLDLQHGLEAFCTKYGEQDQLPFGIQ